MKKQLHILSQLCFLLFTTLTFTQNLKEGDFNGKETPLFQDATILPIKLKISFKEMKSKTNDSTYTVHKLSYMKDGGWDSINVELRKRGNYRLKNCYFPPLKMRINKENRENTIFTNDKKLKVVLPCLIQKDCNDNIIKEYIAYRLFEHVSPYHFDVRLLDITLIEQRNRKNKVHNVKGIFVEDVNNLEDRYEARERKQKVHPVAQDNLSSVRNDIFQYMIGNTDFSTAYRHNEKLIYRKGITIPVPYDFDMCGLVNPSYGVVSQIGKKSLPITHVTDRYFRGFKRDPAIYEEVRQLFLTKRKDILNTMSELESFFKIQSEYDEARQFIIEFFAILENDKRFEKQILARARKL